MTAWTNSDGLKVVFNEEQGYAQPDGQMNGLSEETLVVEFDSLNPTSLADITAAGNTNGRESGLPANAYITKAWFICETAFTSAGATTLSIGLAQAGGSVINSTGIDATIAKTAMDAVGEVVVCDGTLVGGTATIGTAEGFVYFTVATGPYTAGNGHLYINYIKQK
jgi:hypothetical protein